MSGLSRTKKARKARKARVAREARKARKAIEANERRFSYKNKNKALCDVVEEMNNYTSSYGMHTGATISKDYTLKLSFFFYDEGKPGFFDNNFLNEKYKIYFEEGIEKDRYSTHTFYSGCVSCSTHEITHVLLLKVIWRTIIETKIALLGEDKIEEIIKLVELLPMYYGDEIEYRGVIPTSQDNPSLFSLNELQKLFMKNLFLCTSSEILDVFDNIELCPSLEPSYIEGFRKRFFKHMQKLDKSGLSEDDLLKFYMYLEQCVF